jgi:hypothetical protein
VQHRAVHVIRPKKARSASLVVILALSRAEHAPRRSTGAVAVLAASAVVIVALRRGPVATLLLAAAAGVLAGAVGLTIPG